jgi:hypothetical protein
MEKIKLMIAAVAMLSLVSSSAVYADGFAPGEGLYVGAFVGAGTGIVQPKVATTASASGSDHEGGTFEATEGGLGLAGIEGGGWVGYGYKMGDLYAGIEGEMALGDVEFKLTSDIALDIDGGNGSDDSQGSNFYTIAAGTVVSAKKDWTGGMSGRLGYYINPSTLFAVRAGVLVSKFDVAYGTAFSENFYAGGPSFGASLESTVAAIDPNLSLRMDAVYTDYLTSPVSGIGTLLNAEKTNGSSNSEVTGSALSARVGLTYSFFDVNSLF